MSYSADGKQNSGGRKIEVTVTPYEDISYKKKKHYLSIAQCFLDVL